MYLSQYLGGSRLLSLKEVLNLTESLSTSASGTAHLQAPFLLTAVTQPQGCEERNVQLGSLFGHLLWLGTLHLQLIPLVLGLFSSPYQWWFAQGNLVRRKNHKKWKSFPNIRVLLDSTFSFTILCPVLKILLLAFLQCVFTVSVLLIILSLFHGIETSGLACWHIPGSKGTWGCFLSIASPSGHIHAETSGVASLKVGSQETPGVTGKFGLGMQNEAG